MGATDKICEFCFAVPADPRSHSRWQSCFCPCVRRPPLHPVVKIDNFCCVVTHTRHPQLESSYDRFLQDYTAESPLLLQVTRLQNSKLKLGNNLIGSLWIILACVQLYFLGQWWITRSDVSLYAKLLPVVDK